MKPAGLVENALAESEKRFGVKSGSEPIAAISSMPLIPFNKSYTSSLYARMAIRYLGVSRFPLVERNTICRMAKDNAS